jgi:hypothetical protein
VPSSNYCSWLVYALIGPHGRDFTLAQAFQWNGKGKASLVCYSLATPLAFVSPWVSGALFACVALM